MFERRRQRARAAEEFLRSTRPPSAPAALREFGLQRIVARVSTSGEPAKDKRYLRHPVRLRRAVLIPVLTLIVMIGAISGLYAASAGSLPGSPLYESKIFFERVRLALTSSSPADARLEMEYCERRIRELQEMLHAGGSRDWERWLREYRRNLSQADSLLESMPEAESGSLSLRFESTLSAHARLMEEMLAGAPEESLPFLQEAYMECHGKMMRMRGRCGMGGENTPMEQEGGPGGPGGGGMGYPQRLEDPSGPGGDMDSSDPGCSMSDPSVMYDGESDRAGLLPQGTEDPGPQSTGATGGYDCAGEGEGVREGDHGPFPGRHLGT